MSEVLIDFLNNFQILTPQEISVIAENTIVKEFKKGTLLLKEGQTAKNCFSILKGCIREYYIVNGDEKTTAFFTEGHAVTSFTSYTNQTPSNHYLICVEDSTLTVSNQSLEKEMCDRLPRLESIIRIEVEKNTGKAQDNFAEFRISSPEQRYLKLIETRPNLINRIPQHQIASYIGVTPESLSRLRKRMAKK
jgi:CRP-like cAMP-binding protein